MHHVNDGLVSPTYVKAFYILPDWTTLHVVLLEVESEALSHCVDAGILFGFLPRLDLVEGDRILNLLVIVHVVAF